MSQLTLVVADGRTSFHPGEKLDVVADWQLDECPETVELRLVWYTRGKGDTDLSIVKTIPFDGPRQFESRRCTVTLPEAPYSFSGKLISLIWAVELLAEPSGESCRVDITMAPEGEEVVLYPDDATDASAQ